MSYIGNPIVSTDFPIDYKSGNGSTTAFTLSIAPASVNAVDVEVSGISQSPQTYTISGTTLTFSAAPPAGSSNIVVKHRGIAGVPNVPALLSVTPSHINGNYSLWNLSGADVNYTAGNVGIGTASPSQLLELNSASSPCILLKDTTNNAIAYMYADDNAAYMGSASSHPAIFKTVDVERMRLDTSGNLLFNSGYGSVATAYGCRAWVNFNGTGTVAIRGSGNVSSITDNGTGDYTINLATAMPDVNYSAVGMSQAAIGAAYNRNMAGPCYAAPTTTTFRVQCSDAGTKEDPTYAHIVFNR